MSASDAENSGPASSVSAPHPVLCAYSVGPPPPASARRLHLNEFRFAHAPRVLSALRDTLAEMPAEELLTRYQTGAPPELLDALAQYTGVPSARHVLAAAGSDEILRAVIDTSGARGHRRLIMGVPGYTHFEHYARLRGLEVIAYPIGLGTSAADHLATLRYYAAALAEGSLVYLCSPNNPTGDLWAAADVARLAADFPRSLFLVDEAYIEFASCLDAPEAAFATSATGVSLAASVTGAVRDPFAAALNSRSIVSIVTGAAGLGNVVVARTLSKAFGLAALRVGYAVGTPETIGAIGVAVSPKALSPLAARVAVAALGSLAHYWGAANAAKREGRQAVAELSAAGWWALDTPGNFFLVYAGDAAGVAGNLARAGVHVRSRDELPGLAGFVRVTAGRADDRRATVLEFLRLEPPATPPPQTLYAPKGVVAALKTLVRRVLAVFADLRVEVWAQGGTLLGMLRHRSAAIPGGMIPWDDDIDLAYLVPSSGDPLAGLGAAFREAGLTLQRNRTDAYWQVGTNLPGESLSAVHVDVFSYREVPGTSPGSAPVYVVDDPRFRDEAPGSPRADCNTRYSHAELFPLSRAYRFYDLAIPVPAASEVALRRALGDDFMTTAKVRTASGLVTFPLRDLTPG